VVVVADVALANEQARKVLERILGVGGVDRPLDLLARRAFDRGRDLGRQRSRSRAADGDDAEGLGLRDEIARDLGGLGVRRRDQEAGGGRERTALQQRCQARGRRWIEHAKSSSKARSRSTGPLGANGQRRVGGLRSFAGDRGEGALPSAPTHRRWEAIRAPKDVQRARRGGERTRADRVVGGDRRDRAQDAVIRRGWRRRAAARVRRSRRPARGARHAPLPPGAASRRRHRSRPSRPRRGGDRERARHRPARSASPTRAAGSATP
jgi:hypothetical protein